MSFQIKMRQRKRQRRNWPKFAIAIALIAVIFGQANAYTTKLQQQQQNEETTTATATASAATTTTATPSAKQTKVETQMAQHELPATMPTTTTEHNSKYDVLGTATTSNFNMATTTTAAAQNSANAASAAARQPGNEATEIAGMKMQADNKAAITTTIATQASSRAGNQEHDTAEALQIELKGVTETGGGARAAAAEVPNESERIHDNYMQLQQQQQQHNAKHYEVPETMTQNNALNGDNKSTSKLNIIDVYATQSEQHEDAGAEENDEEEEVEVAEEEDLITTTTSTTTSSTITPSALELPAEDGLRHIISASNEKLKREHIVFEQPRNVEEHRQNLVPNEVEGGVHAAPLKQVNHMTIEKISDFTGKLLADQDDIITEIEQKFMQLNVPLATVTPTTTTTAAPGTTTATDNEETTVSTPLADSAEQTTETAMAGGTTTTSSTTTAATTTTTTTHKPKRRIPVIAGHEFIERRVKKSFGFPLHHTSASVSDMMSMPHMDFANTKFTDAGGNAHAPLPIVTARQLAGEANGMRANGSAALSTPPVGVVPIAFTATHPEFSTTKFYNSKELYNELMLKKLQKFVATKNRTTTTTTKPTRSEAKSKPSNAGGGILTLNKLQQLAQMGNRATTTQATATNTAQATTTTTATATATTTTSSQASGERTTKKSAVNSKAAMQMKAAVQRVTLTATVRPTVVAITTTTTTTATSSQQTQPAEASNTQPVPHASAMLRLKSFTMSSVSNKQQQQQQQPESNNNTTRTTTTMSGIGTTTAAKLIAAEQPASTAQPIADTEVTFFTYPPAAVPHTAYATPTHAHSTVVPGRTRQGNAHALKPIARPRVLTRLQEKINALECELLNVPPDSHLWRGNETHELLLPIMSSTKCTPNERCPPEAVSWEGEAEIQSGDILIVEINDALLLQLYDKHNISVAHTTQVYQVTRPGHEHCDVTEGILLDITPLVVDGRKLVTLYDKDLTEGVNLLIVVSELWGKQCVRLKVTTKTDNCGENADCSGKGVCYSNQAMEEYECQCCSGFAGPHCEEIDACTPSPCTNNGICVDLSQGHDGNAYQCLCPYGYTGKNCQYESDPCNASDCLNGGTCVGNSTQFRCDCAAGYTGLLCQHSLNECESSPCVHGICVDQEDGFRCFCQPGFAGELCNFEYNECESNPCQNAGECIDHIGSYECHCTKGYTGNRCQIKVDFCANKPCPEGQRCVDHGNDYSCECPEAANGIECGNMPRMQCNVNPCTHGGTCWSSGDSFYCACRPGFTGTMCEDEFVVETVVSSSEFMVDDTSARNFNDKTFGSSVVLKSPIELHNAYFAAGVLAAALFIVAIVVTICHCKVNQTYRKFSTRSTTFFPIIGFGRRSKTQNKLNKHWLSGKGFGSGSTSSAHSNAGTTLRANTATQPAGQHQRSGSNVSGQLHERPFQRHLAMNLENDMYYTVDFCENSQHSPLIQ